MEHARKLVLLPRDSLDRIQHILGNNGIKSVQTPGTTAERLDAEMSDILNLPKDNNIDDREKWNEYNRALQRYLLFNNNKHDVEHKFDNLPEDLSTKKKEPELKGFDKVEDSFIIAGVPKTFKTTASNLIRHLKRCGNITWSSKGAVAINGKVLQGANIVDLVGDAMRGRKRAPPTGSHQFAAALREAHVPREYIGNNRLWKKIDVSSPSANSSSSEILAQGYDGQHENFVSVVEPSVFITDDESTEKNLSRRQRKHRKRTGEKSLISGTPKKKAPGLWSYL